MHNGGGTPAYPEVMKMMMGKGRATSAVSAAYHMKDVVLHARCPEMTVH